MAIATFYERGIQAGCKNLTALENWPEKMNQILEKMEKYVAEHSGTFFYHRPIYDDDTWLPNILEFAVFTQDERWGIELFNNKPHSSNGD